MMAVFKNGNGDIIGNVVFIEHDEKPTQRFLADHILDIDDLRTKIEGWRDKAKETQAKLNLSDPDKQIRRYSYLGGMKGAYQDVIDLLDK